MFNFVGISFIVFKFSVINSPSEPSPSKLQQPINLSYKLMMQKYHLFWVLHCIQLLSLNLNLESWKFFSKLMKSSSEKIFDSDSIFSLCLDFSKFFEGLKPTEREG